MERRDVPAMEGSTHLDQRTSAGVPRVGTEPFWALHQVVVPDRHHPRDLRALGHSPADPLDGREHRLRLERSALDPGWRPLDANVSYATGTIVYAGASSLLRSR